MYKSQSNTTLTVQISRTNQRHDWTIRQGHYWCTNLREPSDLYKQMVVNKLASEVSQCQKGLGGSAVRKLLTCWRVEHTFSSSRRNVGGSWGKQPTCGCKYQVILHASAELCQTWAGSSWSQVCNISSRSLWQLLCRIDERDQRKYWDSALTW